MPSGGTLRVAHLAKWAPPVHGGIETVVRELLAGLARLADQVEVDCYCYADRAGARRIAANVVLKQC